MATPHGDWIAGILLLFLSGWLFMRPHEFVTGGADAGVYVSLCANIANTGSLLIREPMLAEGNVDAVTGFSFSSVLNLKRLGVPAEDGSPDGREHGPHPEADGVPSYGSGGESLLTYTSLRNASTPSTIRADW